MKNKINYIKKVNIYKPSIPLWLLNLLKSIFITFIICCAFVAVFSFIYICTSVDGVSMYPTINALSYDKDGNRIEGAQLDSVYINRFASCDYGDIIIINNPPESLSNKYVIKRLIAKGGDKIAIAPVTNEIIPESRTYKVFIIKKGSSKIEVLEETYLDKNISLYKAYKQFDAYRLENEEKFIKLNTEFGYVNFLNIKEDELFYLGDNREDSKDCSKYGAVNISHYVGRVDIIVYGGKNNFSYIFLYFWNKIFG